MAEINLSKYGITGTTEVVYNPSYEMLFEEETKSTLEGFEKGQANHGDNDHGGLYQRQVPEKHEGHQAERVQVRGRILQLEFRIRQCHFLGAWALGRLALHDGLAHVFPLWCGVQLWEKPV